MNDQLPDTTGFGPSDYWRREGTQPFGICFEGRPFDEGGLPEIAPAYELTTEQRHAPPDFTTKVPGGA